MDILYFEWSRNLMFHLRKLNGSNCTLPDMQVIGDCKIQLVKCKNRNPLKF